MAARTSPRTTRPYLSSWTKNEPQSSLSDGTSPSSTGEMDGISAIEIDAASQIKVRGNPHVECHVGRKYSEGESVTGKDRTVEADQRTRDEEAIASSKEMEDQGASRKRTESKGEEGVKAARSKEGREQMDRLAGGGDRPESSKGTGEESGRNQEAARKQREDEAAAAGLKARRQRDERRSAIERRERRRGCKDESERLFGNGNRGTQQSTSIVRVG